MGNALISKRFETDKHIRPEDESKTEKRIFPTHMYNGPLKLGDPYYRGLSKMEEDPMIPQRLRDIGRELCHENVKKFSECTMQYKFAMVYKCTEERNELCECIKSWVDKEDFRNAVIEEYLNERSHYRQTGIKSRRYERGGKFVLRDETINGPMLDENGKYRPQKPTGWDESYPDGPPPWTDHKY